jgi:hypothetical protein
MPRAPLSAVVWEERVSEWRLIEDYEFPPFGPNVLVVDGGHVCEAAYDHDTDAWYRAGKNPHDFDFVSGDLLYPSHWMPLPAPPSLPQAERKTEA